MIKEYGAIDGAVIDDEATATKATTTGATATTTTADAPTMARDEARIHDHESSEILAVPVNDIAPSPHNPRKTYSAAAMDELVQSVADIGVMQPILLRPANNWPAETRKYEVVYGHRRLLASQALGLATIPAMVRELTDIEAARLQAVENLQREDLTALDEGHGYAAYIEAHGITRDQLAAQVGKSRTHIYKRLALARLVPEAAQALQDGKIQAEVATLIARMPPKLQPKALAVLANRNPDRDYKWTYRRFRTELLEKFSLDLKDALFDTGDALLVELAGACTTCPKRSGMTPEVFGDIVEGDEAELHGRTKGNTDICTDPDCFEAKKKAHLVNQRLVLEAKGDSVVSGSAARAAIDAHGNIKGAYVALADVRAELKKIAADKKPLTVLIQDPRDGKTYKAVKRADLADSGVKVEAPVKVQDQWREQQKRDEAKRAQNEKTAAAQTLVQMAILSAVRAAAAAAPRTMLDLQLIAGVAWDGVDHDGQKLLARIYGVKTPLDLEKAIGQMSVDDLGRFCLDCALVGDVYVNPYRMATEPSALLLVARQYGIDVAAIRAQAPAAPAGEVGGEE